MPLFAGGGLRARHARTKSELEQARASLALAEREVERDARSAWARFKTARAVLTIREKEVRLAQERLNFVERLYNAGTRYQKVDWQRSRVGVARKEVDLVRARVDARESWIRLLRAAGLPVNAGGPVKPKDNEEDTR